MSEKPVKKARPWDMFNKNIEKLSESLKSERLDLCKECPFFINATQQCKKCGCHMPWKTALPHAECPIGKWNAVDISNISYKDEGSDA